MIGAGFIAINPAQTFSAGRSTPLAGHDGRGRTRCVGQERIRGDAVHDDLARLFISREHDIIRHRVCPSWECRQRSCG